MAFSVKDFWSYTDDPSTLKELVLLVAKPGGGGFSLINMTKEEFFRIAQDMAIQIDTPSAKRVFIDFGGGRQISYIGSTNSLLEEVTTKLISAPGQDPTIIILPGPGSLKIGNSSQAGTLSIEGATGTVNVTNAGTGTRNSSFREGGVIQVNPVTSSLNNAQLASVSFEVKFGVAQWSALFLNLNETVATLEIEMPGTPQNGWRVSIFFGGDSVTSITHVAPGDTTVQAPLTSAADGDRVTYIYAEAADTWFPIS